MQVAIGGSLCYNAPNESEGMYGENTFCLPWQDLSQVTDAKLYNAIPAFAGG